MTEIEIVAGRVNVTMITIAIITDRTEGENVPGRDEDQDLHVNPIPGRDMIETDQDLNPDMNVVVADPTPSIVIEE